MAIYQGNKPLAFTGADGKSAYQAAVEAGFTKSEQEFNTILSNAIKGYEVDQIKVVTRRQYNDIDRKELNTFYFIVDDSLQYITAEQAKLIKVDNALNADTIENKSVATIISEVPQATNLATGTVKLSDATAGIENAATGLTAATPKAVADALTAAKADTAAKIAAIPVINDGTNAIKGKVKLSDATAGTEVAATGATAATPKAVADALTAAKAYVDGKGYQTSSQVVATKVNNATNTDKLGNVAAASYYRNFGNKTAGQFYTAATNPTSANRLNYDGEFWATRVHGAVFNDYAETRRIKKVIEPGYIVEDVQGTNEKDYVELCSHDMSENAYVVSDTFGFLIGDEKSDQYEVVPLGVSGRVLAYVDKNSLDLAVGDKVCSTISSRVRKMTLDEVKDNPFAVIGIVSSIPDYNE